MNIRSGMYPHNVGTYPHSVVHMVLLLLQEVQSQWLNWIITYRCSFPLYLEVKLVQYFWLNYISCLRITISMCILVPSFLMAKIMLRAGLIQEGV